MTGQDFNPAVLAFHEKAKKPVIMGSNKNYIQDIYCHLKKKINDMSIITELSCGTVIQGYGIEDNERNGGGEGKAERRQFR